MKKQRYSFVRSGAIACLTSACWLAGCSSGDDLDTSELELAAAQLEPGAAATEGEEPTAQLASILTRLDERRALRDSTPVAPEERDVEKAINCAIVSICNGPGARQAACILDTRCTVDAAIDDCIEDVEFVCGNVAITDVVCTPDAGCNFAG